MRMKIVHNFLCFAALAGLFACNQQIQNATVVVVTPEVKPVVKPDKPSAPAKQTKPEKAPKPDKKPKPVQSAPVVPPVETKPAQAEVPGQAEIEVTPAQPEKVKPVTLKPLGKRVFSVPMNGKYVALTFDDGPHPTLTPKALDILNRHGAKGTFFMLGQNAARYKSVVARAAAEGHELGVHTWSHIKMNSSSRAKVDSEIDRTQKTIAAAAGVTPRVMRPPYGATNKTLVDHMYNRYGMASIMWDVDTLDWRKPGVQKVVNVAVNKARPGSIILVHDIHATTLAALEEIVTGLQARGFQLVTVSELMQIGKREAAESREAEPALPAAEVQEQPAATPAADAAPVLTEQVEPAAAPVEEPAVAPAEPVVAPEYMEPVQPQGDPHAASDAEPAVNLDELNMM